MALASHDMSWVPFVEILQMHNNRSRARSARLFVEACIVQKGLRWARRHALRPAHPIDFNVQVIIIMIGGDAPERDL